MNKKGFTLAELLIVVAIIAVLVGVSIPIFTTQLEKSREATDLANVRSAYAQVMMAAIDEDKEATYSLDSSQTIYKEDSDEYSIVVDLKQKKSGWTTKLPLIVGGIQSATSQDGDNGIDWLHSPEENGRCIVKYNKSSECVVLDWQGTSSNMNKTAFSYVDFNGYVPATWQGVGSGTKNGDQNNSWYNQSISTQKLVELEPNSKYSLTYTIPADYNGKTIQMGTLLFKNQDATDNIKNDVVQGQNADSGWISSSGDTKNNQKVIANADGSKTITQTIFTDDTHIYFGANFYTGSDLRTNTTEKRALESAIQSIVIEKQ